MTQQVVVGLVPRDEYEHEMALAIAIEQELSPTENEDVADDPEPLELPEYEAQCHGCDSLFTTSVDAPATCALCGELACDECASWSPEGPAHAACAEEDDAARKRLRDRIENFIRNMPVRHLRRVDSVVCYLTPDKELRLRKELEDKMDAALAADSAPKGTP